ncbi:UDP-glucose 4-epimerase [Brachionus plicatilis]|uniref:UDP-glucose 4-epimerase n=1 Tax=Brachionus plicatilis TaxID=10195 RepID=A0A3M7R477_BRAPC|nr:UDP-glucose 4-epimerase [Brachionus plicatilis]
MSRSVLVTGGAGFIGSHCVIELIKDGFEVVIIDNWTNSSKECIPRLEQIAGKKITALTGDICDKQQIEKIFESFNFFAVLHLAAFKAVGESCRKPIEYFMNNVYGSLNVLEAMKKYRVKNFVFSSSCTVYGKPEYLPLDEKHPSNNDHITNPYGRSKFMVENILKDLYSSDKSWNIVILRYFNPVGAHESGLIGEDPRGEPTNLMPFISQVAVGRRSEVNIFGSDYDTKDGTGVRDYIHIFDLARGHSLAMAKLEQNPGLKIYNLGTGKGYSVLEMIRTFEKVTGLDIPKRFVPRRAGDVPSIYAISDLAEKELGWKATKNLEDMCRDMWNWQSKNPNGFECV